ncbi:hypothetical protein ACMC5O_001388 [Sphingomonas sediminicola]|uniref:hypothetical protein n=1 Tax=Sphingomonas sediminicola TaxID=386874 RepID=UPI003CF46911
MTIRVSWVSTFLPGAVLFGIALAFHRPAQAVPAFAEQTGRNCAACHVGGFGPELTQFGREFKLGGYTLRMHKSVPLSAMAIASWTHTQKDQVPPPEHLSRNNNLVLDQASLFVAGGIGEHLGGFAQLVTYDGVEHAWSWDNIDIRAVTNAKLFGQDSILGLTLNNNPTAQDPWNTLPAWGFPFTETAVSQTPGAGELIDDPLAGNALGLTAYVWFDHKFYAEVGGYSSPSRGFLDFVGMDPEDPGSLHGIAPYGRIAYQADLAGGTFEVGANVLKAAIFPERDRSSGLTDRYTDWGLDSSWLKSMGKSDSFSAHVRFEHERGNLRASCALVLVGDGTDTNCGRYDLNEWRAAVRYNWHDKVGVTVSPFSISGSRDFDLYDGNGRPDSNGVLGQIDFTPWGAENSPLGPRFNARLGVQYTLYGKFNGRRHNYDFAGANARDNNALRLFTWVAF